jgi:hypothetical protein
VRPVDGEPVNGGPVDHRHRCIPNDNKRGKAEFLTVQIARIGQIVNDCSVIAIDW